MSHGSRVDVGLRSASRGIALVVAAAGGYVLVLLLLAVLVAWIVRVV